MIRDTNSPRRMEKEVSESRNLNEIRQATTERAINSLRVVFFLASIVHSIEIFLLFMLLSLVLQLKFLFFYLSDFHEHQPKIKKNLVRRTERRRKQLKLTVNCSRFHFKSLLLFSRILTRIFLSVK